MNMLQIAMKCNEVAKHWDKRMPMMTMEECGELIQAISKLERYFENMRDDPNPDDPATLEGLNEKKQAVIDEIGDMWISLMALQSYYEDGTWGDKIEERIEEKLNRKY